MRIAMERQNRAKQFMPFSALKGYEEALRREEEVWIPQPELMEDYQEELDRKLQQIEPGDQVTVTYYRNHQYQTLTGMVKKVHRQGRFLMVDDRKILFDRIYQLMI